MLNVCLKIDNTSSSNSHVLKVANMRNYTLSGDVYLHYHFWVSFRYVGIFGYSTSIGDYDSYHTVVVNTILEFVVTDWCDLILF